jgi:hypothetical protein
VITEVIGLEAVPLVRVLYKGVIEAPAIPVLGFANLTICSLSKSISDNFILTKMGIGKDEVFGTALVVQVKNVNGGSSGCNS